MPIADTIIYPTVDGYVTRQAEATWDLARDSTAGDGSGVSSTGSTIAIRASKTPPGRGAGFYVSRSFFRFDVSDVNFVPKTVAFRVRGLTTNAITVIACVKANFGAILTTADFLAIEGWVRGADNTSNVTYYASNSSSWSTSSNNTFGLNQQALVDIAGQRFLEICLLDVNYDLEHTGGDLPSPGATNYSGCIFVEHGTSSYRPNIRIAHQDDAVFFGANF